ncbi:MAG TPA: hypothetical protein VJ521_12945, partial [Acidobacteriota bacterium]|nr:hypothetical protein [Acidobacteriota bacterium]
MLRTIFAVVLSMMISVYAAAQTAEEIVSKHIEAEGGLEKLKALESMKVTGKLTAHGGMEAPFVVIKKRPDKVRMEFTMQGLTGVSAYDGKSGWSLM